MQNIRDRVNYIKPNSDGITQTDLIKNLKKTVDSMPEEFQLTAKDDILEYDEVMTYKTPPFLLPSFQIFTSLRKCIPATESISYSELYSYCKLYEITLEKYEIDTIKVMDATFVTEYNRKQ